MGKYIPVLSSEEIKKRKLLEDLLDIKNFLQSFSLKYGVPVMDIYDALYSLLESKEMTKSLFVLSHILRELVQSMIIMENREIETQCEVFLMEKVSIEDIEKIKHCCGFGDGFSLKSDEQTILWKGCDFDGHKIPRLRKAFPRLDWEGAVSRIDKEIKSQSAPMNYLGLYLSKYSPLEEAEIKAIVSSLDSIVNEDLSDWAHVRYGTYSKKQIESKDFYQDLDAILKALLNCAKAELKAFSRSDMIDEILINNRDIKPLWSLIQKDPLQKEYFLRNLGEEYFVKLKLLHVFQNIPNVDEEEFLPVNCYWPEGLYLLKISSTQSEEVLKVLEVIDFGDHQNYRAKEIYINIILSLYEQNLDITSLVNRIFKERWITNQFVGILGLYPLKELIKKLVEKGTYDGMGDLVGEVCGVKKVIKTVANQEKYGYKNPEPLLRDNLVIDILKSLQDWTHDTSVLKALKDNLCDYTEEEMSRKSYSSGLDDFSYISKPDLEDFTNEYYDYGDELINTVIKLAMNLLADKDPEIVEKTLTPRNDYSIFRRIRMILYSKNPSINSDIIAEYLIKEFGNEHVRYEYFLMLKESFVYIKEDKRTELFLKVKEFSHDDSNKFYLARFFNAIEALITEGERNTYKVYLDLNKSYNEPTVTSYSRTAKDSSPYTMEEISELSIKEVFLKIIDFTEVENAEWIDKPTEDGFIGYLKSDYNQRPEEYWNHRDKLETIYKKPKIFQAFIELFLQGDLSPEDFEEICTIISNFIKFAIDQTEDIKELYYIFYSILQALKKYIEKGKAVDYDALDSVLKTLLGMVDSLDVEDINMEDFYSKSVNTIEGSVYHCYFALLTNKNTGEIIRNRIEKYLTLLLTEDRDSIINSVAGYYFLYLGDEFNMLIKNRLFLNKKTLFSVWSGFLLMNTIYKKDFKNMVDCYWFVIDHFENFQKYKFEDMIAHRFYEFITLGYLFFSSSYTEGLFSTMFEKLEEKEIINIIHFIGMQIRNSKNKPKRVVVKKIWRKLLSRNKYKQYYPLLGLWIDIDFFNEDEKWLIETLSKTLKKTDGDLEGEYNLSKQIEGLVGIDDELLLECIKILASVPHQHYSLFSDNRLDLNRIFENIHDNNPLLRGRILQIKDSLYSKGYESFREKTEEN
ncbi:MAG: hypothetical protein WCY37_01035 [Candidatus Dojkabacteria bacterium]